MASIRKTKKEIAFVIGEVISNCNMALYFQPASAHVELVEVVESAIELHDTLIEAVNNPAEKHNKKLVKKHYCAIEDKLIADADVLFEKISAICQKN